MASGLEKKMETSIMGYVGTTLRTKGQTSHLLFFVRSFRSHVGEVWVRVGTSDVK